MTRPIRALIVDDEPAARRGLRLLLERHSDLMVVGECIATGEIGPAVDALDPDVVFLDVRLPGGTGIDALRDCPAPPLVVLVTAYEEHALEAFDVEAIDYLLKPFSDEAFERSLRRVRRHLARRRVRADTDPGQRIPIRCGERIRLLDPEAIRWVAAAGDYVRIHTPEEAHLLRETMQALEARLDDGVPSPFVRIHRSTLVRADFIHEIRTRSPGRYTAVLRDGSARPISRTGQARLEATLGIRL
jgi:two-component system LytT family response regulator